MASIVLYTCKVEDLMVTQLSKSGHVIWTFNTFVLELFSVFNRGYSL